MFVILKQLDGKFALWSGNTSSFPTTDCTSEEIKVYIRERVIEAFEKEFEEQLHEADKKPLTNQKSWKRCSDKTFRHSPKNYNWAVENLDKKTVEKYFKDRYD